jgi:DNA-binding MarR family transcriptional regulator
MSSDRNRLVHDALEELDVLISIRRRAICEQPCYRGVSLPQLHILMMVLERERMTVSEIASLLNISTPSASAIVDRMEEHGLVTRQRDEIDRRVVHVAISDHGRGAVDGFMGMQRDNVRRMLGTMTLEELNHVVCAMAAVRKAVARIRNEADLASAPAS